ncbi:hypothetical protein C2857_003772 [Epichloe festucae Fl1]|uniref:Uncharacterized protein n=1 Tax=Epichloe festucae (strain Fl1) TaxID=877507 RepID=A0A7U3Q0I1_EPIFF|nr:hypothetical protein C2857_003772 [Epichloe festucae Fl1]
MIFSCCNARAERPLANEKLSPRYEEEVYPIHLLDQPTATQKMLTWVMCFNDVLNAPKLHESLCHLLEIGDWKKLGARLRVRNDGLLEAYAPKSYSHENPACTFFFDDHHDSEIESHPAGKHFSLSSSRAFTQIYPATCRLDMAHPDFPMTVQDVIDRKLPQLVLHILAFYDATIVTISMPSNAMDNASFQSLLKNWSLVLAGRQDEVALVFGPHKDVLQEMVSEAEEKKAVEDVNVWSEGISRYIIPEWWRRRNQPPMQRRMVYIPKVIHDEFLGEIRHEMARMLEDEEQRPIITDAEILLAWMTKLQGGDENKTRAVAAYNAVNLRHRLSFLRDPSGEYLQMLTIPVCSRLSADDVKESIGHIALHHKRNMDQQTSESHLVSFAKSFLEMKRAGNEPFNKPGDAGPAGSLDYCNMTPLHLFSAANFGPAVLHCGGFDNPRYNPPGTMTTAYSLEMGTKPKDSMCHVIGKDSEGHFWMYCQLEPTVWVRLEEELYRLQKCVNSPVSGNSMRFPSASGR